MRTFIAIDLEPELKKTLSGLIDELSSMDRETRSIKWIRKEGMHLTLKFLGETREEERPGIEAALKSIAEKSRPFILRIRGTGFFPAGRKNLRVIWVGIEEDEGLMGLQSSLEGEMEKLGFPREQRPFRPHLTLGRVKSPVNLSRIMAHLEKSKERPFGEMAVKKITFFRSVLLPAGAQYSILSEFDLK